MYPAVVSDLPAAVRPVAGLQLRRRQPVQKTRQRRRVRPRRRRLHRLQVQVSNRIAQTRRPAHQ